jgi:tRNA A37 methylthiotransferase MiaB
MKKLYIETYGCQMNVADSEVVASIMQMADYDTCESLDEADAVFLNTCSVRDNAEQKIVHRLEALNALKRKGRKLIIGNDEPITCRPADKLAPELDKLRAECAQYMEQEEDVLSYALFEQVALKFFEYRKNQKYGVDANADAAAGVHTV